MDIINPSYQQGDAQNRDDTRVVVSNTHLDSELALDTVIPV